MRSPGMASRYRVTEGYVKYPADAESLAVIRKAGGYSRLSDKARASVRLKTVMAGEYCDDAHEEALAHWLEKGRVVVVDESSETPRRRRRREAVNVENARSEEAD
jgi:hypothetical protein